MIEFERIYKYNELFNRNRIINSRELQSQLEISSATVKRDIALMKDRFLMPIVYDREAGGYKLEKRDGKCQLPGLWFTQKELDSLLTIYQIIETFASETHLETIQSIKNKINSVSQSLSQ